MEFLRFEVHPVTPCPWLFKPVGHECTDSRGFLFHMKKEGKGINGNRDRRGKRNKHSLSTREADHRPRDD